MSALQAPEWGTPERSWWSAGAAAEARLRYEGTTADGRQFLSCVEAMAQGGSSPTEMVAWLGAVFCCEQPWRERLRIAWRIWRSASRVRPRRSVKVYLEPRDWWVGYYRGDDHHYVCLLPCVVIRWNRRVRQGVSSRG
jgi:hypothetical protein